MQKEKKFWVQILTLPILCLLLVFIDFDKVSNIRDFLRGFAMATLIIIMLWQVYSLIRSVQEMQTKKKEETKSQKGVN